MGSILGQGNSACSEVWSKKKKKKENNTVLYTLKSAKKVDLITNNNISNSNIKRVGGYFWI